MTTELLINKNYSRTDDLRIWEDVELDGEHVTAPYGYTVRIAGDDVLVINDETETVLHCIIVDSDSVIES